MNQFIIAACAVSFLYGSIPFGLIFGKIFAGKDIQKEGSGNIGATNVSRVAGFWPAGLLTFVFDLSKGLLPVLIFREQMTSFWESTHFFGDIGNLPVYQNWILALVATLSHCFTPWLRFNGGKGVSTAFGAILIISPLAAIAGLLSYGITFYLQKVSSLSSMIGLGVAFGADIIINNRYPSEWLFFLSLLFVVISRHEKNLTGLVYETEKTFDSV